MTTERRKDAGGAWVLHVDMIPEHESDAIPRSCIMSKMIYEMRMALHNNDESVDTKESVLDWLDKLELLHR